MRFISRLFLMGVGSIFLTLVRPQLARAQSDFSTTVTSNYLISTEGLTTVTHQVTLTNLTSTAYAKEFSLEVGSPRLKDITVVDQNHLPQTVTSQENDASTVLTITFTDPTVGLNQSHQFTIQYSDLDVSQNIGQILEVNIPKLNKDQHIDSYQILVTIPKAYGQPTTITPDSYQLTTDPAYTHIAFSPQLDSNRGISMTFGHQQSYDVSLIYRLDNPSITPIDTQLAFPPDTNYQRIYLSSINPPPASIEPDPDGNWIATYHLEAKTTLVIDYHAIITTFNINQHLLAPTDTSTLTQYLTSQPYWPTEDSTLKEKATTLQTPDAIFDFVTSTLKYNYARIEDNSTNRLGAKDALIKTSDALCLEFSDTFITLNRAAGVPARLITGYSYTENQNLRPLGLIQDVLHAWPEFFDFQSGHWHPVDPTWTQTTGGIDYFNQFDFNHIAFAIQGLSSEKPYPAGFYKLNDNDSDDIGVSLSHTTPTENIKLITSLAPKFNLSITGKHTAILTIQNQSNVAIHQQPLELALNHVKLAGDPPPPFTLLPYQNLQLPLELIYTDPSKEGIITTTIYGQTQTHTLDRQSNLLTPFFIITFTTIVVVFIFHASQRTRRLLVSKPHR